MSSAFSREAERVFADALAAAQDGPFDLDALCADNPAVADELRGLYGNWLRIQELLDEPPPPDEDVGPETRRELDRAGPYVFLSRLGEGGQGAVFLAEDSRIRRRVAVKVLRSPFASGAARLRFRREAEVVAELDHPAICGILEAEVDGEVPYIAMPFVRGTVLVDALEGARSGDPQPEPALPLRPRTRRELHRTLAFFEKTARALHAAHGAGVVHRDVKPANLMITPECEPVILDFGMARAQTAEGAELTVTGDLFGTPHYMSPEQWSGRRELDARTDVYALGVTLFEALTLERPFEGRSQFEIQNAILKERVPDSRALNDALTADVQVVLARALAKEPAWRYASALELAEDLRRIREYEPIRARPTGPILRLRRWAQREPIVASAIVVLSFALVLVLRLWSQTREALDGMFAVRAAERSIELSERDGAAALALAIHAVELGDNEVTRSALLSTLDGCALERRIEIEHANRVRDLVLAADGRTAAVALDGQSRRQGRRNALANTLWLVDVLSGETQVELASADRALHSVTFAPDGSWVAAGGAEGLVELWMLPAAHGAKPRFAYDTGAPVVVDVAASPDGRRLAAQPFEGPTLVFDVATGDVLHRLAPGSGTVGRARFSPDGERLLVSSVGALSPPHTNATEAVLFDVQSGERIAALAHPSPVRDAAFSHDGAVIATAERGGRLRLWDGVTGASLTRVLALNGSLDRVAFDPSGRYLAAAGEDAERPRVVIVDRTTDEVRELVGHDEPVRHLAFDPTGVRLASAASDAKTILWSSADAEPVQSLRAVSNPDAVRWTTDGRRVVTFDASRYVRVWRAGEQAFSYSLRGHDGAVRWAAFLPGGGRVASAGDDGTVRVWSTPRHWDLDSSEDPGRQLFQSSPLGVSIREVRLSEDGRALALGALGSGLAVELDLRGEPSVVRRFQGGPPVVAGGLLRGGGALTVDGDGRVWHWPPGASEPRRVPATEGRSVRLLRVAPDGSRTAIVGSSADVLLLDAELAEEALVPADQGSRFSVTALAWRRDSRELAIAYDRVTGETDALHDLAVQRPGQSRNAGIRRFDLDRATLSDWLETPRASRLAYDRRGRKLLVLGDRGGVNALVFDLGDGSRCQAEVSQESLVEVAALSSGGSVFSSGGRDSIVAVWDAATGEALIRHRQRDFVSWIAFPPEEGDRRVVSAGVDGSLCVWPIDPMPAALARQPRELDQWERLREQRLGVLPD